ncbi:hypothetical protein Q3G72_002732 [Acer saccharum]|nr:hypothetical protein Q3G72_002732 [Acer saccharum]
MRQRRQLGQCNQVPNPLYVNVKSLWQWRKANYGNRLELICLGRGWNNSDSGGDADGWIRFRGGDHGGLVSRKKPHLGRVELADRLDQILAE